MDSGRDIILEFLDLLNSAMHIEQLLQISSDFFIRKFKLLNCSIVYGKTRHTESSLSPELINAETVVHKQVIDTNSFLIIPYPKKDMILQHIEGIESVDCAMLAFAIRHNNKAGGVCVFYSQGNLSDSVELVSLLLSKLSIAVSRARYFEDAQHYAITDVLTGV